MSNKTKLSKNKILLAIPAYNCEKQISRVLDEIDDVLKERVYEIAVIDNGSSDNTVMRVLQYRKSGRLPNLHIYRNEKNYSLGGTHKVAFLKAQKDGCSHVIILHGDNQAVSGEANVLIDYAETHPKHQTVLGSRFSKGSTLIGYDRKRIWGNRVLNTIYTVFTLRKCSDLGSGLNLFALNDLDEKTYLEFADKLTFNYELLLDLIKRKVSFTYAPITWREEDQVTNARNWIIFRTALLNLLKWRFSSAYNHTKSASYYQCVETT
jgi:dolichol-phosphate mannosyltransferase